MTMLGRLRRIRDLDPGGTQFTTGLEILVAAALAVWAAAAVGRAIGLSEAHHATLTLHAALIAFNLQIFVPPGQRLAELRLALVLGGASIGLACLLTLLAPGATPTGRTLLELGYLPVVFVAFCLRRFGPPGFVAGLSVFLSYVFLAVAAPDRAIGPVLILAAVSGTVAAASVRLLAWRHSGRLGIRYARDRSRAVAAHALEGHTARPNDLAGALRRVRLVLRRAVADAAAQEPERAEEFTLLKANTFRMTQSLLAVVEARDELGAASPLPEAIQRDLSELLDRLRQVVVGSGDSDPQATALEEEIRVMAGRLDADVLLADARGIAIARLVAGLVRICRLLRSPIEQGSTAPSMPETTAKLASSGMPVYLKVALQAALAVAVTILLEHVIGLSRAYWATLTVAFVLQASLGETFTRMQQRVVGTAIGVVLGIVMAFAASGLPALQAASAAVGLVLLLLFRKERYTVASAAIGFTVVVALHLVADLTFTEMLARIYETAIGAGVALLVARFVLPVTLASAFLRSFDAFIETAQAAARALLEPTPRNAPPLAPLLDRLTTLRAQQPHIVGEALLGGAPTLDHAAMQTQTQAAIGLITLMHDLRPSLPPFEGALRAWRDGLARRLDQLDPARPGPPALDGLHGSLPVWQILTLVEFEELAETLIASLRELRALRPAPHARD